jgi:hypothetical protein
LAKQQSDDWENAKTRKQKESASALSFLSMLF